MSNKKVYIKPQLCKEFGVTERAFNHLIELDLIQPERKYRNGLQVIELSESDRTVLLCAKNCLHNAHAFRLPFQRFLWLRFMQMPLDLLEFELREKNLIDCRKYDNKYLMRRYDQFLAGLPEELHDCVKEYRPPKSAKEKELFNIVLDVCELRIAYEHPEWDQAFVFMTDSNIKTIVDASLSTLGTYQEISDLLHEILGADFTPEGLMFYQQLFHDTAMMNADDMKNYFKGIAPSRRSELQKAHGLAIRTYKIQSGLQRNIKTDEVIDVALEQVAHKVLELTSDVASADSAEVYQALRTFNILLDRHTKIVDVSSSADRNVPDFFKNLKMMPQDVSHGRILIENPNESQIV